MANAPRDDLFPDAQNPEGTQVINERCLLRTQGGHRVVLVSGMSLAQYAVGDGMSDDVDASIAADRQLRAAFTHLRLYHAGGVHFHTRGERTAVVGGTDVVGVVLQTVNHVEDTLSIHDRIGHETLRGRLHNVHGRLGCRPSRSTGAQNE
jgi:hypothetical protein